jgi:hypothetical protein
MQYTLMFYLTPDEFDARTDPKKSEAFWGAFGPYMKAIHDAGVVVAGAGLQPPDTATSLRRRDGKQSVQDGPFAETKEQLGGFSVIEAPNLSAALEWAKRYPSSGGGVEVRPNLPPSG